MSERKVLVHYYSPEFNPATLPPIQKPKNNQHEVRGMLPFSIQCVKCGERMGRGTKWNGRKEEVKDEMYLNTIKIYRLYFRCSTCLNEITFKTDPKNSDYTIERGASRNFEPWKQAKKEEELQREKAERDEMGDEMKVLENRVEQSKREMAIQDAIEEQRERNARVAGMTTDALLHIHRGIASQLEEDQIEKGARDAFANKNNRINGDVVRSVTLSDSTFGPSSSSSSAPAAVSASSFALSASSSFPILKRLPDPVDSQDTDVTMIDTSEFAATTSSSSVTASSIAAVSSSSFSSPISSSTSTATLPGMVLLKKRKKTDEEKTQRKKDKKQKLKELAEFCN